MKILIDTREQKPWSFPEEIRTERRAVPGGDYTVDGLQGRVAIERKGLSDLVGTVVGDWLRFVKQLRRMAGMEAAVIAIEATPMDLYGKKYLGDANPEAVMGRCHAIYIDYGIPVIWWGDRESAQRAAHQFLKLAAEKLGNPCPP